MNIHVHYRMNMLSMQFVHIVSTYILCLGTG